MYEALLVIFLLVSICLVALIMLQKGKGVEAGTYLGTSSSGILFSSNGSNNLMNRLTEVLATLFFIISLILGNIISNKNKKDSEWDTFGQPVKSEQVRVVSESIKPSSDIPQ